MNKKFLSIVVPYFKETQREMFPLLSSLQGQVGVDFGDMEVLLVNDGAGNRLPAAFLELFHNLEIRVILAQENRGPGVARQAGLDAAGGEYVLFCDADDCLHSVGVLGAFLTELRETAPDILASPWLEEIRTPDGFGYLTHDDEATWMHGKAFCTEFLRRHDIRFHDELRVHEDSYFLAVAYELTDRKRKLTAPSYVWRWSEGSITRCQNSNYTYASIPAFHRALALSFAQLERRGLGERLVYKVVQLVLYTYFILHQDHWQTQEHAAYLHAAEQSFAREMRPFLDRYRAAPPELLGRVYGQERQKHFANAMETELLADWLCRIGLDPQGAQAG